MTQPYSFALSSSALSIRMSSRGALGRPYSSRLYFLKLYHALRMGRLTSMEIHTYVVQRQMMTFPRGSHGSSLLVRSVSYYRSIFILLVRKLKDV